MSGNGGRECSGATVTTFGTTAMSLRKGMKGACMHVSNLTLKSIMKLRKSV